MHRAGGLAAAAVAIALVSACTHSGRPHNGPPATPSLVYDATLPQGAPVTDSRLEGNFCPSTVATWRPAGTSVVVRVNVAGPTRVSVWPSTTQDTWIGRPGIGSVGPGGSAVTVPLVVPPALVIAVDVSVDGAVTGSCVAQRAR